MSDVLDQVRTGRVSLESVGAGAVRDAADAADAEARVETPILQVVLTALWEKEAEQAPARFVRRRSVELGGADATRPRPPRRTDATARPRREGDRVERGPLSSSLPRERRSRGRQPTSPPWRIRSPTVPIGRFHRSRRCSRSSPKVTPASSGRSRRWGARGRRGTRSSTTSSAPRSSIGARATSRIGNSPMPSATSWPTSYSSAPLYGGFSSPLGSSYGGRRIQTASSG